jgi:elongation factor G
VNGLDKEGADFSAVLAQLRQVFSERIFPLGIPINSGPGFDQVLDVPRSEDVKYLGDKSGKFKEEPVSGELAERVSALHKELIEHIAEADDKIMERFFEEGGTLTEEELRANLHLAIQRQSFIPVFPTSAENNIGVARLMDFIAKYGSSPVDRQKVQAADADGREVEVALSQPEPVLYVFKTMSEAKFGELSFFRLYSGSIRVGSELYNSDRRVTEKMGQVYLLNGNSRTRTRATRYAVRSSSCRYPRCSTRSRTSTRPSNSMSKARKTKSHRVWPRCTKWTQPSFTRWMASCIKR